MWLNLKRTEDTLIDTICTPHESLLTEDTKDVLINDIQIGELTFSPSGRYLKRSDGEKRRLTPQECLVLKTILDAQGKTVPKEDIYRAMHNALHTLPEQKIIDVTVCKLRSKMNSLIPKSSGHIATVWGVGFQLRDVLPNEPPSSRRGKQPGLLKKIRDLRSTLWNDARSPAS